MNVVLDNLAECIYSAQLSEEDVRVVMGSMQRLLDSLSRIANRPLSLASVPRPRYSEVLQSAPVVLTGPQYKEEVSELRIRLMSLGGV